MLASFQLLNPLSRY